MDVDANSRSVVSALSPKDRRIIWLLNHTTLRNVEVKMLVDMGFEVFCPKSFPDEPGNRSASVDWSWDQTLTIPEADLSVLNKADLYDSPIDPQVQQILNAHFGTAIFAAYPYVWDQLLTRFDGRLMLRAFGLTSKEWNYFSYSEMVEEPGFRTRLMKSLDRFWFAQAYPNLDEIEPDLIAARSATLPLGLPQSVWSKSDTWKGGSKQIVFVCPDIEIFDEARTIYRRFKRLMGGLPHVILGAQGKPERDRRQKRLKDSHIVGRLPREEFDAVMQNSAVMYYHSRLPRHLHYHPLEAVCMGMPLIFMRDGMLGQLGGKKLPGACRSFGEARRKVKRVLRGDRRFIDAVVKSQAQLLDWFRDENVASHWRRELLERIIPTTTSPAEVGSIAVLLGEGQSELTQRAAVEFALQQGRATLVPSGPQIVLGAPEGTITADDEQRLRDGGILVRRLNWAEITHQEIFVTQEYSGFKGRRRPYERRGDRGCIPRGSATDFQDCGLWYVVADQHLSPAAPIHPYQLVVNDLFSSEWPLRGAEVGFINLVAMARDANTVLVTSPTLRMRALRELSLTPPWIRTIDVPLAPEVLIEARGAGPDAPISILLDASVKPDLEWLAVALAHYRFVAKGGRPLRLVCLGGDIEGFSAFYADEQPDDVMNPIGGRRRHLPVLNLTIEIFESQIASVRALSGSALVVLPDAIRNAGDILRHLARASIPVAAADDPERQALLAETGVRSTSYRQGSSDGLSSLLAAMDARTDLESPRRRPASSRKAGMAR